VFCEYIQGLQQSTSQPTVSVAPPPPVTHPPAQTVSEVPAPHLAAVMSPYSAVTSATELSFNKVLTTGRASCYCNLLSACCICPLQGGADNNNLVKLVKIYSFYCYQTQAVCQPVFVHAFC